MMRAIIEGSKLFIYLEHLYAGYWRACGVVSRLYRQSFIFAAQEKIRPLIKACFQESQAIKFILSPLYRNVNFTEESAACHYGAAILRKSAQAINLETIWLYRSKSTLVPELRYAFTRAAAPVLITAACLNFLLSFILKDTDAMAVWFCSLMLFALGLAGLSAGRDLKSIKESSLLFKILRKLNNA
jgi:hypothetical protein